MEPQESQQLADDLAEVLQSLPPVLRAYVADKRYSTVAAAFSAKYSLSPAQAHVLERDLALLLIGINTPDEFATALKEEAQISDDVVRSIMTDVNEEVFLPLQREMETSESGEAQQSAPMPPAPVRPVATLPIPDPASRSYAPPPQSPSYPDQGNDLVASRPASYSVNATPSVPRPQTPGTVPPGQKFVPQRPVVAAARPMNDASALLEDHVEPHLSLSKDEVPPNLPGAMPAAAPMSAPTPAPARERVSVPMTPITSYTKDPYREPIDEVGQ